MTLIYLDTSALAKLVVEERESEALASWLDARPEAGLCTSTIGKVELLRLARRRGPDVQALATTLLADLALVPADTLIQDLAAALDPSHLRTLDALHLASALALVSDLHAFVAYDGRLVAAAEGAGLVAAAPGAPR